MEYAEKGRKMKARQVIRRNKIEKKKKRKCPSNVAHHALATRLGVKWC